MKNIEQFITNEIKWCKENPDITLSNDYQNGFIKGLEQSLHIIVNLKHEKNTINASK
jgi:hypothetical protein